jgi:SAM-dependent methyltransferase
MLKTGHDLTDEEISERYEKLGHRGGLGTEFNARVIRLAGDLSGKKVLDAGCGFGDLLRQIRESWNCELYGADFAASRVAVAEGEGIMIKAANIQRHLPFEDRFFDVAFSTEVIEHLKDPGAFLAELRRVTRKEGKIVLTIPNATGFVPFSWVAPYIPIRRIRETFLPYEHPLITDQPIDTCYTYGEIIDLIRGSGLTILKIEGWRYFRYLFALPLARTLYPGIYPWVERWMPLIKGERMAYNLMFLCGNP